MHSWYKSGGESLYLDADVVLARPYNQRAVTGKKTMLRWVAKLSQAAGQKVVLTDLVVDKTFENFLVAFKNTGRLTAEDVIRLFPGNPSRWFQLGGAR